MRVCGEALEIRAGEQSIRRRLLEFANRRVPNRDAVPLPEHRLMEAGLGSPVGRSRQRFQLEHRKRLVVHDRFLFAEIHGHPVSRKAAQS